MMIGPVWEPMLAERLRLEGLPIEQQRHECGKWTYNDVKYLPLAILYSLRFRESGEDLSDALKGKLIAVLSTGLLSGISFPKTMVPKVDPASRPAGDTLSKYVLRFVRQEDTLADRELGAAMGGV